MHVPNKFPTLSAPYRIAFVGEAPGKDEIAQGQPFVGQSGKLLWQLCSKANIMQEACFVGNVCQLKPEKDIAEFDWWGPEIQDGLSQLSRDLEKYQPHLVVCLGALALHAFKDPTLNLKKRKVKTGPKFVFPYSMDNWRGSFFISHDQAPMPKWKTIATYHPAFCLRQYENTPLLMFDLKRAVAKAMDSIWLPPQRNLLVKLSCDEVCQRLQDILDNPRPLSLDIEGYVYSLTCISIADQWNHSFIVPFRTIEGHSYWTLDEEVRITRLLALLLADHRIPKVWQNGLYDRFVLQFGFHMPVAGNKDDTMLKWWEKYCELEKSLAVQASILTDEPYYKDEMGVQDTQTHYTYCCRDSAVTFEINEKTTPLLSPSGMAHYRFNHSVLNSLLYAEMRGIRYDVKTAKSFLEKTEAYIYNLQAQLDYYAGCGLPASATPAERVSMVRDLMAYKADPSKPKKDFEDCFERALELAYKPVLSQEERGFLSTKLKLSLNTKSPKLKEFLYTTLGLPEKYSDTGSLTSDFNALIKLKKQSDHPAIPIIIEIGYCRTLAQMLHIGADPDGRVRTAYNLVGTKTGRITSSESPTGSGYNLQTIPDADKLKPVDHPLRNGMRVLFQADPGCWLAQMDLKGSDGWTIGAHLDRLGDATMIEDLRHGIKPAQRLAYMLRHGFSSLRNKPRSEIKELLKEVKKDDWDYFCSKCLIWGICYLMGPDLCIDQVLEESEGKVQLNRKEIDEFRRGVFEAYRPKLWHDWMASQLKKKPELTSASGHVRRFFGRPDEILGAALANEPQENTTYATNLAAYRLWHDMENRLEPGEYTQRYETARKIHEVQIPFRVEPLHQVHDALIVQFRQEETLWAASKIRQWFNNPLIIAGQQITIPFDGGYGDTWGSLDKGTI